MHAGHVPTSAVFLIIGSVLCFTFLDTINKHLAPLYPVPLLIWARLMFQAVAMVLWLGPKMKLDLLRTPRFGMQATRGLLVLASGTLFVTALKYLPLAEATSIAYSSPAIVVVMAVVFLRENMTIPRIAFVLTGMTGMLLIVRPNADTFNAAAFLAVAGACLYATYQILTRKLADEDPRVTLFYPGAVGAIVMSAIVPFVDFQTEMPLADIGLICMAGVFGTLGHLLFILAFQRAPASALTPFTYMQLVWATLIGWFVFNDLPDRWSFAGMVVIAGSGLLIALYERRPRGPELRSAGRRLMKRFP